MDEHEVPTHVQAEDRVLLWFTFPQIVALTAVAALSYGVYQVAPFGPEAVRIGAGLVFALVGVALVVGKVGGRRLPAVATDLLRFGFGARRFQGPPAQLVRAQPPAPSERSAKREATGRPALQVPPEPSSAAEADPDEPRVDRATGPVRRRTRKPADLKPSTESGKRVRTRGERMPFKPRNWFRKRDRKRPPKSDYDEARQALARPRAEPEAREQREQRFMRWPALLGGAAALAVVASITVCTSAAPGAGRRGRRGDLDLGRDRVRPAAPDPGPAAVHRTPDRDPNRGDGRRPGGRQPGGRGARLRRPGRARAPLPARRHPGPQWALQLPGAAGRSGPVVHLLLARRARTGRRGVAGGRPAALSLAAGPRRTLRPAPRAAELARGDDRGFGPLQLPRGAGRTGRAGDRLRPRPPEPHGAPAGRGDARSRARSHGLGRAAGRRACPSSRMARPCSRWRSARRRAILAVEITAALTPTCGSPCRPWSSSRTAPTGWSGAPRPSPWCGRARARPSRRRSAGPTTRATCPRRRSRPRFRSRRPRCRSR